LPRGEAATAGAGGAGAVAAGEEGVQGALRPPPKKALPKARISYCMCQSLDWLQVHDFFGGIHNTFAFEFFTVIMLIRTFAQRCKRLTPLLAAPAALLLLQGQAKAFLTYNIYEYAGNVVVQTSGSLDFTGATLTGYISCGSNGAIEASFAVICTGPDVASPYYNISGPTSFNGTDIDPASSVSGIFTALVGAYGLIAIDPAYVGTPEKARSTVAQLVSAIETR